MLINVVTLFPEMFSAIADCGVTSRAIDKGLINMRFFNPREFAKDRHRTVDDKPYGGGPGMLMKIEPLVAAIKAAKDELIEVADLVTEMLLVKHPFRDGIKAQKGVEF